MPPNQQTPPPQDYSFIMNPAQPQRRSFIPTGSPIIRITIVLGVLLSLFVIFSIAKNILFPGPNFTGFIGVAQDQQRMIHVLASSTSDSQQAALSSTNKNFVANASLSLASQQTMLETYLQGNHLKLKAKQLNIKISPSLDSQLQTAISNGNYNNVLHDTMQQELNNYQQQLKQAYLQATGPKGRQLLNEDYKTAQLLLQQLNTPGN